MTDYTYTITVTLGDESNQPDPSGGPGLQKAVWLEAKDQNGMVLLTDPLEMPAAKEGEEKPEVTLVFKFAEGTQATFTDFRYIRSCDKETVEEGYSSLGRWFRPVGDGWTSKWTAGEMMTGNSTPGTSMTLIDRNTGHTSEWTYLYLLEWVEGGVTFVSDPKIKQGPSGGEVKPR